MASVEFNPQNKTQLLNLSQPVGVVMSATVVEPLTTLERYISFQMIDALLSGMRYPSGLLHTRLRGKQLVYVVHALPMRLAGDDLLFVYALTDSVNVKKVAKVVQQSMNDVKTSITPKQFELAKAQVMFNMQNTLQKNIRLMMSSKIDFILIKNLR